MYPNSLTVGLLLASLLVVSADEVIHQQHPAAVAAAPVAVSEAEPAAVNAQAQPGVVEYQPHVVANPNHLYSLMSPDSPLVVGNKPQAAVGGKPEQYGAPEPAGMPANYKPFGSWGLYVGGNPPDGYYTNFYKSLDGVQGVSSQQQPAGVQQPNSVQQPGVYKQSGPVVFGANQYPYVYSAGELNSAYPAPQGAYPTSYSTFEGPEFYATKKVGSPAQQAREISKTSSPSSSSTSGTKGSAQQQGQQQAKGYAYSSPVSQFFQQPQQTQYQHYSQSNQVVPYSVPVGSQIVGSQPGADGAFSPYGVHAFTRYAVKPAFNAGQGQYQQYHHSAQQHHYQPSPFQSNFGYQSGYQNYYPFQGVPSFSYQFGPIGPAAAPVAAPVAAPTAPAAPISVSETPVVPSSNVAQAEYQQAPQSPVQVGQAALASPSSPVQQEQQVEQQQVVEKQAETKSASKQ